MLIRRLLTRSNWLAALTLAMTTALPVSGEVFFYRGPDGERLVSDRPMPGYQLINQRDSLANAGHILANRPIATGGPREFESWIAGASEQFGVDPALIEAVIQVESSFDPHALSHAGATGLMQLTRDTANQYAVADRYNPRANIYAGVEHLRRLMDRFNNNLTLVLAAYNAGPGAVERYKGVPPFPETRRYIAKVTAAHAEFRALRYGAE